jgi:lysophospholipase L1-like esterase
MISKGTLLLRISRLRWWPVVVLCFFGWGLFLSAKTPRPSEKPLPCPLPFIVPNEYSFVRYEKNELLFPGGTDRWNSVFERLEKLVFTGEGKLNFVHIGGSHVQGGSLTDKLRSNLSLLTLGVEGERGFVFPYKLAGTNSPRSIRCSYTGNWTGQRASVSSHSAEWGMSGIAAITTDSAATFQVQVFSKDSVPYAFHRARIYYSATPNVQVSLDSSLLVLSEVWNPAMNYKEFVFGPTSSELKVKITRTDSLPSSFTLQGLYLGDQQRGITYNTIGVNGAGTYSYLKCPGFAQQIASLKADVVVFGIGVNDANCLASEFNREAFEARYDSLIAQFVSVNPETCFLFITNNDTYYDRRYPNPNGLEVQKAMKNLATKHQAAVFDFFEIMGGLGAIDYWVGANLAAKDRIHFTPSGYELQADLMFASFQKAFGDYLSRSQP